MFQVFPPELYHPIIENIDTKSDLYRLLFVSRIVSCEAERVIYHTIHIQYIQPPIFHLFLHLSRCPRVARYVRSLSVYGIVYLATLKIGESGIQDHNQYWQLFNQTLSALTNLRDLMLAKWISESSGHIPMPVNILSGCAFKLQVLRLTDCSGEEFPDIDLSQVKELVLQEKIRGNLSGFRFRSDVFPSLQVLALTTSQLIKFGADNIQHVKALRLTTSTPPWEPIEGTFVNVTSLEGDFVGRLLKHFPCVRYISTFLPLPGVTDVSVLPGLSDLLSELASLKSLEKLCLTVYGSIERFLPHLHIEVFSRIDSLQEFVLVNTLKGPDRLWDRYWKEPLYVSAGDEWKDSRWF